MTFRFGPISAPDKYLFVEDGFFTKDAVRQTLAPNMRKLLSMLLRAALVVPPRLFTARQIAEELAQRLKSEKTDGQYAAENISLLKDVFDPKEGDEAIDSERGVGWSFQWKVQVVPDNLENPAAYLAQLREQCDSIDIRGLNVGSGKANRFPINQLYIQLKTANKSRGDRSEMQVASRDQAGRDSVDLESILEASAKLVIVGDPGSGKTTFLRKVALAAIEAFLPDPDRKPFPILIRISELAEFLAQHKKAPSEAAAPDCIAEFLGLQSEKFNQQLSYDYFRARLRSGPAILFLDGLDEAPSGDSRESIVRLFEAATRAFRSSCRFVVTTRPKSYEGTATLSGFEAAEIEPLEQAAVQLFLTRWCDALFPNSKSSAKRHLAELEEALHAVPEIRRMARNPVMLTALAVVHWNEKRLPEQRAELYESVIKWLVRSRKHVEGRPSEYRCLALLRRLALAMQEHPKGRLVDAEKAWAAEQLAGEFPNGGAAAVRAFLDQEEIDSGVIGSRGALVRFRHLTFQEYLAAHEISTWDVPDQLKFLLVKGTLPDKRIYLPEWREVVLLLSGLLCNDGVSKVDRFVTGLLRKVPKNASLATKARCVGLLGGIVNDLKPFEYAPADARYKELLDEVLAIFEKDGADSVPFADRLEAANALGQAGDPRLNGDNWIRIAGGTFLMGGDEGPKVEVAVEPFWIAKYPVTVAEYAKFVDDEGYSNPEWWVEGRGFDEPERLAPYWWEGQLARRNHPVIGISWFEAKAYCAWRGGVRLLLEKEWEFAARGEGGREHPWGDASPDKRLANYGGNVNGGDTTPVGLYPHGAALSGVLDLAGNAWEWVEDAEVWEGKERLRVLRGGSWVNVAGGLRCGARWVDRPGVSNYDVFGLRVAREV